MNDPIDPALRSRAIRAARGDEPFDLLITGGSVVDVGTGEIRPSDVGLVGSLIASVHAPGSRPDAAQTFDATGRFVAPGLIDMHVHYESSMLTPGGYASVVCPRGTTTIFCDPHEIANVAGLAGMRYSVDASRGLPVRFIIQAPSCVPPMPGLELSGHDFGGPEIAELLSWPEVGAVAEVMDMIGVVQESPRMVDVVGAGLESGKLLEGHASGLTGAELQAYLVAGVNSDHEIFTPDDALEKLRAGMTVELRWAVPHILGDLVQQVMALPEFPTHLLAATDDLFAMTLLEQGGVDELLRLLIGHGMPPVRALRMATANAAYRLGRTDLGMVAPGRLADLIVLSDLPSVRVEDVFSGGRHVASGGRLLVEVAEGPATPPLQTVKLDPVSPEDFVLRLDVPDGRAEVKVVCDPVLTRWGSVTVEVRDGVAEVPSDHLLQVAFHRHGRIPAEPKAGLISGWGNWTGAVATTVAHDTHNLVVFGVDPVDMAAAANAVIRAQGGVAVAKGGEVLAIVELPIAGLLSPRPPEEVARAQRAVQEAATSVGLFSNLLSQPLFQVMVNSLACLPGPHITDLGLVDGTTGEIVPSMVLEPIA
jgi:adenine deaminase